MKSKLSRVYCVEGDPDYGCAYVAARTSKDAKYIAMGLDIAQHLDNPYIELRVTWCKSVDRIDFTGELDIFKINEVGLTWWACEKCDSEDFEILDNFHYKCKSCGKEAEIPYVY